MLDIGGYGSYMLILSIQCQWYWPPALNIDKNRRLEKQNSSNQVSPHRVIRHSHKFGVAESAANEVALSHPTQEELEPKPNYPLMYADAKFGTFWHQSDPILSNFKLRVWHIWSSKKQIGASKKSKGLRHHSHIYHDSHLISVTLKCWPQFYISWALRKHGQKILLFQT